MYPSKKDISPTGGVDLDEQSALDNFFGLDREAVLKMFKRDSDILHVYLADLVHMGAKAFDYYIPALEQYLLWLPDQEFHEKASDAVDYVSIRFRDTKSESKAMRSLLESIERRKHGGANAARPRSTKEQALPLAKES